MSESININEPILGVNKVSLNDFMYVKNKPPNTHIEDDIVMGSEIVAETTEKTENNDTNTITTPENYSKWETIYYKTHFATIAKCRILDENQEPCNGRMINNGVSGNINAGGFNTNSLKCNKCSSKEKLSNHIAKTARNGEFVYKIKEKEINFLVQQLNQCIATGRAKNYNKNKEVKFKKRKISTIEEDTEKQLAARQSNLDNFLTKMTNQRNNRINNMNEKTNEKIENMNENKKIENMIKNNTKKIENNKNNKKINDKFNNISVNNNNKIDNVSINNNDNTSINNTNNINNSDKNKTEFTFKMEAPPKMNTPKMNTPKMNTPFKLDFNQPKSNTNTANNDLENRMKTLENKMDQLLELFLNQQNNNTATMNNKPIVNKQFENKAPNNETFNNNFPALTWANVVQKKANIVKTNYMKAVNTNNKKTTIRTALKMFQQPVQPMEFDVLHFRIYNNQAIRACKHRSEKLEIIRRTAKDLKINSHITNIDLIGNSVVEVYCDKKKTDKVQSILESKKIYIINNFFNTCPTFKAKEIIEKATTNRLTRLVNLSLPLNHKYTVLKNYSREMQNTVLEKSILPDYLVEKIHLKLKGIDIREEDFFQGNNSTGPLEALFSDSTSLHTNEIEHNSATQNIEYVISTGLDNEPSEALQTSVVAGGVVNNTIVPEYSKVYVTTSLVREYTGVPNNSDNDDKESHMSTDENIITKSLENQPALADDL
jgi:hypothetical protein